METLKEIVRDWKSRQEKRLTDVRQRLSNLEMIDGTSVQPPHFIVHGTTGRGAQASEMRTAISIKLGLYADDDDVEFATGVGQLPNTPLGTETLEALNHRFSGKFVKLEEPHEESIGILYTSRQPADNVSQLPNTPLGTETLEALSHRFSGEFVKLEEPHEESIGILYTSRQPADWVDDARMQRELENHAVTRALVSPVLEQVSHFSQANFDLTFAEIKHSIQESIGTGLAAQIRLLSESTTPPASSRLPSSSDLTKRPIVKAVEH